MATNDDAWQFLQSNKFLKPMSRIIALMLVISLSACVTSSQPEAVSLSNQPILEQDIEDVTSITNQAQLDAVFPDLNKADIIDKF